MKQEGVPVYLFTGFLEAGKTRFIQQTLEDNRFNQGERTLLLLCEEGEEEYEPDLFAGHNVFIESVDDPARLNPEHLDALLKKHDAEQVMVEYNGMWMLDELYSNMPERWVVCQEFLFVDAGTFLTYNANMRSLVYDKLKSAELVVFNRATDDIDRMEFHKIVRGANRSSDIAYEYASGKVEYDDIQDPLPFDLDAPVVEIRDDDYAIWYRDMAEDMPKYDGKTVRLKAMALLEEKMPAKCFILGRRVMTCCTDDIAFMGLVCLWDQPVVNRSWVKITATVAIKYHKLYKRKGPVLTVQSMEPAAPPVEEIVSF